MPALVAAGAVLWRCADSPETDVRETDIPETDIPETDSAEPGAVEVAVVHRPRYNDWSWPKGKPVSGEALPATAVREVGEETGHSAVLGPKLGSTRYPVTAGTKVAHYWAAHATSGHFEPSAEVDELRWLPPAEAAALLSYPHDRTLLARLRMAVAVTGTVLLVRHAKAGKREEWDDDDALRPLTTAGRRQAEALRALLALFGAQRVHSVPLLRCQQTVDGRAADLGVPVIEEPALSETAFAADPQAALDRLIEIAAGPGPAVLCSQGGVIPDAVRRLAGASGLELSDQPPSRKGSFWGLFLGGSPPALPLLSADYYDDPLSG